MRAAVSKIDPAIAVMRNTFTTWNAKYLENARICTSQKDSCPSIFDMARKRGGRACWRSTMHMGCTKETRELNTPEDTTSLATRGLKLTRAASLTRREMRVVGTA